MRHCPMFRPSPLIQVLLLGCISAAACAQGGVTVFGVLDSFAARIEADGHGDARQPGLLYRYWLSPAAQVRSPLPGGDIRGMQAGILHTF